MFYLIGDKTWIRCKLGARCMKQEDILNYFYFLCVNVENRLRCSTRTKMDLGRGCLIRVGGRGFWYTRRIGTLSNNIMCLLMFGNAFQCLAKVCDRRPSAHPHGHGQTNRSFETCTDKQKMLMTISRAHMGGHWKCIEQTWTDNNADGNMQDGCGQTRLQNYVGGGGGGGYGRTCEMHGQLSIGGRKY